MTGAEIPGTELTYLISEKGPLLVVSFVGPMTKPQEDAFAKCQEAIIAAPTKLTILSLHDVTTMDYQGIAAFVRLQKAARDKPSALRICFVKPEFKKLLDERGAVRPNEMAMNLRDAIESFKNG